MQLTFGDAEGIGKRKRTRREIFLAETEQLVAGLHQRHERHIPDAGNKIGFDKFHVAKLLGDAVDKVRRQEHRLLSAQG